MDSEYDDRDGGPLAFVGAQAENAVSLSAARVKAAAEAEDTVKVRVVGKYRVVHNGDPYTGGDILDVPESTAAEWLRARFVERVKAPARKQVK